MAEIYHKSEEESTTRIIHRTDSLDYFDAMEVLYYDDMLSQEQQSDSSLSSSTASSSINTTTAEDYYEFQNFDDTSENNNTKNEQEQYNILRNKRKRLRRLANEQRKRLEDKIHRRRKRLKQVLSEPNVVMTIDKISFVCGVLIILIIEAVLLLAPEKMGILYTTLLLPLMVARYVIYRSDLFHYFMYDFCYFAQGEDVIVDCVYHKTL